MDFTDTSKDAVRVLVDGYRHMSPARKLERVFDLSDALTQLARARIAGKYGDALTEREVRLKVASLTIDRQTMIAAFGYDPDKEGY